MPVNILVLFGLLVLGVSGSKACTSGFPERDRLVSYIFSRSGPATRLIPEMRFVCNTTITGYTVAMSSRPSGVQYPIIQTWRKNDTDCQPDVYYNAGVNISISNSSCVNGLVEVANGVFHCDLVRDDQFSVQPEDILGLELPPNDDDASVLKFAMVGKGPISYIFDQQLLTTAVLSNGTIIVNEVPQINLQVESGIGCTSGFPDQDMLAYELFDGDDHSGTTTTILIPEMNFTCIGKLVGFAFTGINRHEGEQDPKVQIWRQKCSQNLTESQPGVYHKIGPAIAVNISQDAVCADGIPKIASRTHWCILNEAFQVSIQPGDILGLELPPSNDNDFDILFTRGGGPTNYAFHQRLQYSANISNRDSVVQVQQIPQITFTLTPDHCTSGFPDTVSPDGSGFRLSTKVTTRLFPDLRFGCSGTILRMTVALVNRRGQKSPKIQIWRESKIQTGVYDRHGHAIPVVANDSVCVHHNYDSGDDIFRCTLNETYQVSVQPGDILGLELPPENDNDYVIYFKDGGPLNYVFDGHLNSTTNISEATHQSNDLPQINLVVMLDEQADPFVPPSCETSPPIITTTDTQGSPSPVGAILGGVIGCIVVAASFVFLIVTLIYMFKCRRKHRSHSTVFNDNQDIGAHVAVKSIHGPYEPSRSAASLPYVHDPTEPHDYEKIPENSKLHNSNTEQVVKLTELCHSGLAKPCVDMEDHGYVISHIQEHKENEHYQTKMESPEDGIYWVPADSVNELYKQLCSNKYREIVREQVQIGVKLGSGQFGIVSKGVWESPKGALEVAVKQLQPGASEEDKVKFLQEAAINGQFRHPNVVMLMGVVTAGEPVMIVLELLSNGNLKSFLIKCRPRQKQSVSTDINEQILLKFCQHIASGMSYLASKSFVHRDLAARNILVSQDKICKISDFGMSRNLIDEKYVSHGGIVPLKWMPPEAINYNKYSTASDVWSFGCVMYEIWSLGHRPFTDLSNAEVLSTIEKGHRLPPPPGTSKELYKIMIQCWQPESSSRPTFPQLVELLSRADFELFGWEEEDLRNSDPQVKLIGAPLETAKNLYPGLQRSYC